MRYFYLGTGSKTWEVLREDLKSFCARFNRRENIAKRYTERVSVQVLSWAQKTAGDFVTSGFYSFTFVVWSFEMAFVF
jgi:hypothetical protein